ncbi:hypothetical protein F8388_026069 [Cannabis sativa]|uniref:Uncharacterized protein n=1 Tax=Cannabis sativa TaxID=3483 RepID=A0A7J6EA33_CANSA|nr:hypothetical protein F8388_026069 [Cannabis sativa]
MKASYISFIILALLLIQTSGKKEVVDVNGVEGTGGSCQATAQLPKCDNETCLQYCQSNVGSYMTDSECLPNGLCCCK